MAEGDKVGEGEEGGDVEERSRNRCWMSPRNTLPMAAIVEEHNELLLQRITVYDNTAERIQIVQIMREQ
jgi:hypothetical protein